MLYLANFSFQSSDDAPEYGHFNYLAEAETVNAALNLIREKLNSFRKDSNLFQGNHHIYLNQIIEVSQLPQDGIMTHLSIHSGRYPEVMGCSLPAQDITGVTAYSSVREDDKGTDVTRLPPFAVFD